MRRGGSMALAVALAGCGGPSGTYEGTAELRRMPAADKDKMPTAEQTTRLPGDTFTVESPAGVTWYRVRVRGCKVDGQKDGRFSISGAHCPFTMPDGAIIEIGIDNNSLNMDTRSFHMSGSYLDPATKTPMVLEYSLMNPKKK